MTTRDFQNHVSELLIPFPHPISPPFFAFLYFRPHMLPLTCTASTVCPPPETQGQLTMVIRSVHRRMLALLLVLSCYVTFHLSVEVNKRNCSCFHNLFRAAASKPHSYVRLHPVLQFCRSLSQITQQLYRRVGSSHFQLTFYPLLLPQSAKRHL